MTPRRIGIVIKMVRTLKQQRDLAQHLYNAAIAEEKPDGDVVANLILGRQYLNDAIDYFERSTFK